jgi:hypothetical protein
VKAKSLSKKVMDDIHQPIAEDMDSIGYDIIMKLTNRLRELGEVKFITEADLLEVHEAFFNMSEQLHFKKGGAFAKKQQVNPDLTFAITPFKEIRLSNGTKYPPAFHEFDQVPGS